MSTIRLTQFSPGAGCGCKIAPKDLEEILKNSRSNLIFENLLVGNDSKDDAAVYDIGDGKAIVSTTDFFTPIVDDPFDFGRISATNAISDIYAMGGKPLMAIAILGWPLDKLPAEIASKVISGAREVCDKAGIPLAGGHSINSTDPIFGLAVTGIVSSSKVKQNNSATEGCLLYLTKPLGIGLVSTAEKFGVARDEDRAEATKLMTTLNTAGIAFADRPEVRSMTDVTGFGLLGHSLEMAEGSGLKAVIEYDKVPRIAGVDYYIKQECIPGGTNRNFSSYGHKVSPMTGDQRALLCDPQTSGGLLLAVEKDMAEEFERYAASEGVTLTKIGYFVKKEDQYQIEVV